MDHDTTYLSVARFAKRTGLPAGWIRRQVRAGQLPSIMAGRQRLIHVGEAEAILARQATQKGNVHGVARG